MMTVHSLLNRYREDVRQVAEAIASVLKVDVTIADAALQRVAGTGRYADTVGTILEQKSVFAKVLREGRSLVIARPGEDDACASCAGKSDCVELAEVCCPIRQDGRSIGVIALIAFDGSQRRSLLDNTAGLLDFLQRMAELLSSRVSERERSLELKNMQQQMSTVLNTVQEGIIAVNRGGVVMDMNTAAVRMLQVKKEEAVGAALAVLLPSLPLSGVLGQKRDISNREVHRLVNNRRVYYIVSVRSWTEDHEVRGAVVTLRELSEVRRFVSHLSTQVHYFSFDMILGAAPALVKAKQQAVQAAGSSATVLVRGESGTGKELFARAIHCAGERRDKPFIAINCAAIPEALLESELFGYEEGAFTGARRGGKPGKFELADGGTVFLDEIGDMSLTLQAKLLRVLQEHQIDRVGGLDPVPVDVRIIAATHKDIEAMVDSGAFRQDLYYRVNVFPLQIPSLRQRREDLPLLIRTFCDRACEALHKRIECIEEDALESLLRYPWPGNIRELENTMEYLVNIAEDGRISARSLPQKIRDRPVGPQPAPASSGVLPVIPVPELERMAIRQALTLYGLTAEGKEKAAQALGISKATLYRRLKEYGQSTISHNDTD